MNIQAISSVSPAAGTTELNGGVSRQRETGSKSFTDVMAEFVQSANQDLHQADTAITDFEAGKTNDLNSVVMASVKADLSFRFLLEMRNRVTESYQELSRMQF